MSGAIAQCCATASRIAATKEDGGGGALRHARRHVGEFCRERPHETTLIDRFVADVAVEVAIRTFRQAERPMHIEAERALVVVEGRAWRPKGLTFAQGTPARA